MATNRRRWKSLCNTCAWLRLRGRMANRGRWESLRSICAVMQLNGGTEKRRRRDGCRVFGGTGHDRNIFACRHSCEAMHLVLACLWSLCCRQPGRPFWTPVLRFPSSRGTSELTGRCCSFGLPLRGAVCLLLVNSASWGMPIRRPPPVWRGASAGRGGCTFPCRSCPRLPRAAHWAACTPRLGGWACPPGSVVGSAPAWAAPSGPGQRGGALIGSAFPSRTKIPSGFPPRRWRPSAPMPRVSRGVA